MISFGRPLQGPSYATFRTDLTRLADAAQKSVHVDTVFGIDAEDSCRSLDIRSFVVFDLHRMFLYEEPAEESGRGIDTVIRSIVGGYGFRRVEAMRDHFREHPYVFTGAIFALEILPVLWRSARPGSVICCDWTSAAISSTTGPRHAPARDSPLLLANERHLAIERSPKVELRQRWTGESLRERVDVALQDLVSPAVGIVRDHRFVSRFGSIPFAMTEIAPEDGVRLSTCFGKGLGAQTASSVAICEACERFHLASGPCGGDLVYGSFAELQPDAVDPQRLFFSSDPPITPPVHYAHDAYMYWTCATDLGSGATVLVPAQEIWYYTDRLSGEQRFVQTTSNGTAIGSSLEEATLFALLELIERDAFMTMWYLKRPCASIDLDAVSDETFQLVRYRWEAAFPNYTMKLFDMTTDTRIPAVVAMALRVRGEGPRVFHAAAARPTVERACLGAVMDLAGFSRTGSRTQRDKFSYLLKEPDRVVGWEDHFNLYALDESVAHVDFLLESAEQTTPDEVNARSLVAPGSRHDIKAIVERIVGRLQEIGSGAVVKELTQPWLSEQGMHCVKVIGPGLYPIWAGWASRRFAVTERLVRLATQFGLSHVRDAYSCNLGIHPLT